jgi:hypothetical protein
MEEQILGKIEKLRQLKNDHIKMGELVLSAHRGDLYGFDLLAVATLNRSMCLLRGFCDLIASENFIAAAPLLRMQLDNCLRFYAGWLVSDPHDFAIQILDGKHVRNLLDEQGNRMTDRYLAKKFSEQEDSRMLSLYTETSGYVHLSNKHMFNAIRYEEGEEDEKLLMKITDTDDFVPTELYIEAINAFGIVTKKLLTYAYGWAYTKENPEITESRRRKKAG